jgi:hypothetical protein
LREIERECAYPCERVREKRKGPTTTIPPIFLTRYFLKNIYTYTRLVAVSTREKKQGASDVKIVVTFFVPPLFIKREELEETSSSLSLSLFPGWGGRRKKERKKQKENKEYNEKKKKGGVRMISPQNASSASELCNEELGGLRVVFVNDV